MLPNLVNLFTFKVMSFKKEKKTDKDEKRQTDKKKRIVIQKKKTDR